MDGALLAAADYELIKSLNLNVRRRVAGFSSGEQRSPAMGGGIEFADYREYSGGDDVRQIDWPVYLRFRKLLVKLCAEERELTVMILLDLSGSMAFGNPEKAGMAKRMACVLAGISARGGNRYGIASCGDALREIVRPGQSRLTLSGMVRQVAKARCSGAASPAAGMAQFASKYARHCLAIFISDMLYPEWQKTLGSLAASGCEAHVLHILSPEELEPGQRGEFTLADMEDGSEVPIHVDAPAVERYRAEMDAFIAGQRSACASSGLNYHLIRSDAGLERVFRRDLRQGGLVC
jgi:uncharacterized protein (DUF58 family)